MAKELEKMCPATIQPYGFRTFVSTDSTTGLEVLLTTEYGIFHAKKSAGTKSAATSATIDKTKATFATLFATGSMLSKCVAFLDKRRLVMLKGIDIGNTKTITNAIMAITRDI